MANEGKTIKHPVKSGIGTKKGTVRCSAASACAASATSRASRHTVGRHVHKVQYRWRSRNHEAARASRQGASLQKRWDAVPARPRQDRGRGEKGRSPHRYSGRPGFEAVRCRRPPGPQARFTNISKWSTRW